MLVVLRVSLALLRAGARRRLGSLEECPQRLGVTCADGQRARQRLACARANPIEPDTGCELRDVVFGEARVGARRARLCTVEARVDAAGDRVDIEADALAVCREEVCRTAHVAAAGAAGAASLR